MRPIHSFEEKYLEVVSSRQSASSHSQRPSVEQLIFLQRILGYKTHPLEIYTRPTILTPRFLYLCYSLKPKARDEWLGYISGRWRGFLQSIDQKLEAVWSCTFPGHRSGPLGVPRDRWETAAGGCLAGTSFRGTFPKAGGAFLQRIDQKPKAVLSRTFSGYCSGLLEWFFAKY